MRSKDRVATAVRLPSGEITIKSQPYRSLASRYKLLNIPILRGAVAFFEMLIIGIRTLNFSAEIALHEAEKASAAERGEDGPARKEQSGWRLGLTVAFSLAFGIGIFFFLPLVIAGLFGIQRDAVSFNLLAGGVRLTMFVVYVWLISLLPDFHRVFQYHGAEHKSIYTYESGDALTPEKASGYTRFHPRCGTSFILIVALLAVLIYAISDTVYQLLSGHPPVLLTRFGVHFTLLPLVAGSSYELLKLSGRTRDNALTKILIQPGLWLQRITTQEPSLDQLEVAIAALEAALGVREVPTTAKEAPAS